jgi:hypothetical protein
MVNRGHTAACGARKESERFDLTNAILSNYYLVCVQLQR